MDTNTAPVVNAAGTDSLTDPAIADTAWRRCEFCDCKTNAGERICCRRGRDADRKTWNRAALLVG
jgi:hypothetical protein